MPLSVFLFAVAWRFRRLPTQEGAAAAVRLHCGGRAVNGKHLPAAGCEAGASPRGQEAKELGCPLVGLLHLPTPERETIPR